MAGIDPSTPGVLRGCTVQKKMAGIAFVIIFPRLVLDVCICVIFAVFCHIQGFLVLSYVHAQRPCLRVHRETGVLRVLLSVNAGLSHTIGTHQLD